MDQLAPLKKAKAPQVTCSNKELRCGILTETQQDNNE